MLERVPVGVPGDNPLERSPNRADRGWSITVPEPVDMLGDGDQGRLAEGAVEQAQMEVFGNSVLAGVAGRVPARNAASGRPVLLS